MVIVGFGIGGMGLAWHTLNLVKDSKITVIGDERPYVRHKLRLIPSGENIFVSTRHLESNGVDIMEGKAVKIRREQKEVELSDGNRVQYDKLVLATGSNPSELEVPGEEMAHGFRKMRDVEIMVDMKPSIVIIVGASYAALHVADAAMSLGAEPIVIVRSRLIRRSLEPEISQLLQDELSGQGVKFMRGSPREIRKEGVLLDTGEFVRGDIVFKAAGVTPDVKLARGCGLNLFEDYAIEVDRQGRTSDPDIFALGDAAIFYNPLTNKPDYGGIGTVACIMAYNVSKALSGTKAALRIPRYQKDVFHNSIHISSVGFTSDEAKKAGFNPDRIELSGRKGWGKMAYLVYCKDTKLVLGASALSRGESVRQKLIDVMQAMLRRKTIDQISEILQ